MIHSSAGRTNVPNFDRLSVTGTPKTLANPGTPINRKMQDLRFVFITMPYHTDWRKSATKVRSYI